MHCYISEKKGETHIIDTVVKPMELRLPNTWCSKIMGNINLMTIVLTLLGMTLSLMTEELPPRHLQFSTKPARNLRFAIAVN